MEMRSIGRLVMRDGTGVQCVLEHLKVVLAQAMQLLCGKCAPLTKVQWAVQHAGDWPLCESSSCLQWCMREQSAVLVTIFDDT